MISGLFSLPLAPAVAPLVDNREPLRGGISSAPERFIAGPENALVRALAKAVIASPLPYNPIVLCGPSGVGKTSLAHTLAALRRESVGNGQRLNIINVTGTDVARSLAHAVETASVADLRRRYHRCHLLLVDELQRLTGKPAAQQFLLTALDVLLRRGSLVIVTLRRSPQTTEGLFPALASRLAGGLVVPLAPPGSLARRELVSQAAAQANIELGDKAIDQLVSGDDSLRVGPSLGTAGKLRHVVFQIAAQAQATGRRDIQAADIAALLEQELPQTKTICRRTANIVAKHFGLTAGDLRGKSRQQAICEARRLAMSLARRLTGASYAEIGRYFGGRDHTTVLHACRTVAALVARDGDPSGLRQLADDLAAKIEQEEDL